MRRAPDGVISGLIKLPPMKPYAVHLGGRDRSVGPTDEDLTLLNADVIHQEVADTRQPDYYRMLPKFVDIEKEVDVYGPLGYATTRPTCAQVAETTKGMFIRKSNWQNLLPKVPRCVAYFQSGEFIGPILDLEMLGLRDGDVAAWQFALFPEGVAPSETKKPPFHRPGRRESVLSADSMDDGWGLNRREEKVG